jgi:ketosteroid isomerase-like protein
MRLLTSAALVLLALAVPAGAQTSNAELMAPIQKFVDSFNKGDTTAAAATHASTADLVIVDELPPYAWQGASAFQSWIADLGLDAQKNGITEPAVKLSAPSRIEQSADHAYVVVPAVYTFKRGGKAMRESAHMTFVLGKDPGGWLIHAWTWTAPRAAAAPARH